MAKIHQRASKKLLEFYKNLHNWCTQWLFPIESLYSQVLENFSLLDIQKHEIHVCQMQKKASQKGDIAVKTVWLLIFNVFWLQRNSLLCDALVDTAYYKL